MENCFLYDISNYCLFDFVLKKELKNKNIVFVCIGTKKYFYDDFGVLVGDKFKKLKVISFGSSVREVNGLNYREVYSFIKNKFPGYKIVVVDSVYINNNKKKPILMFKKSTINVSGINNKTRIGDYGILFNSFSYSNKNIKTDIINLLEKSIYKICQNN